MSNQFFLSINRNFFFVFIYYINSMKFFYFDLNLKNLNNTANLLKYIDSNQSLKKEKPFFTLSKVLVKQSRVKKEKLDLEFNYLNISEFVMLLDVQKEIYLNNSFRNTYFLRKNLVIQKTFLYNKYYFLKLDKIFYKYFLKIKSLGNFFFIQYRIYGLGFRIKRSSLNQTRSLRFEIGYGHGIYYILPLKIKCLKRKRRFFIFSNDLKVLNYVKNHLENFKLLNPYKIRGLKDLKYEIKMKKGKKQSKK